MDGGRRPRSTPTGSHQRRRTGQPTTISSRRPSVQTIGPSQRRRRRSRRRQERQHQWRRSSQRPSHRSGRATPQHSQRQDLYQMRQARPPRSSMPCPILQLPQPVRPQRRTMSQEKRQLWSHARWQAPPHQTPHPPSQPTPIPGASTRAQRKAWPTTKPCSATFYPCRSI